MDVGEAFLFLGSTVHGGGANTTLEPRPVHGFFYCRSYLKPEVCVLILWQHHHVLPLSSDFFIGMPLPADRKVGKHAFVVHGGGSAGVVDSSAETGWLCSR